MRAERDACGYGILLTDRIAVRSSPRLPQAYVPSLSSKYRRNPRLSAIRVTAMHNIVNAGAGRRGSSPTRAPPPACSRAAQSGADQRSPAVYGSRDPIVLQGAAQQQAAAGRERSSLQLPWIPPCLLDITIQPQPAMIVVAARQRKPPRTGSPVSAGSRKSSLDGSQNISSRPDRVNVASIWQRLGAKVSAAERTAYSVPKSVRACRGDVVSLSGSLRPSDSRSGSPSVEREAKISRARMARSGAGSRRRRRGLGADLGRRHTVGQRRSWKELIFHYPAPQRAPCVGGDYILGSGTREALLS